MKRLLTVALLGAAAAGCGAASAGDGGIVWRADLRKARAEARKTGMPMFVVFR